MTQNAAETTSDVKIAGDAIDAAGHDIATPTKALLRELNLLPKGEELQQAGEWYRAFSGTPDSVAVIEAGATAASKWWATAIGLSGAAVTTRIATLWDNLEGDWVRPFALLSVGIVVAASVVAIAHLLASDVGGRAAAMVATIEARRDVAICMTTQATSVSAGRVPSPAATGALPVTPLAALACRHGGKHGAAEAGWKAIAMREDPDVIQYLLVKAETSEWVPAKDVRFS